MQDEIPLIPGAPEEPIPTLQEEVDALDNQVNRLFKRKNRLATYVIFFTLFLATIIIVLVAFTINQKSLIEHDSTYFTTCDIGCPSITQELADQKYPHCDIAETVQENTYCFNPGYQCCYSRGSICLNHSNFTICRMTLHCVSDKCIETKYTYRILIFVCVITSITFVACVTKVCCMYANSRPITELSIVYQRLRDARRRLEEQAPVDEEAAADEEEMQPEC